MNKEIICDKCKKDLTKLPSGEIYYKAIEKTIIQKKKAYPIFKIGITLREETKKEITRYCKDCFKNSNQLAGVA